MKPAVSLIPEADRAPEARRPLTRRETIELAVRQGGRCGCGCNEKLNALTEGCIDEHLISLEAGGTNDLKNRALYRAPCAKKKTAVDKGIIASCKRIEARETGTRRVRKTIPQAANAWPPKGSVKFAKRAFPASRNQGGE